MASGYMPRDSDITNNAFITCFANCATSFLAGFVVFSVLGFLAFLLSLCVIGAHGLLSGTATMDFGGRRGAATAVGVIDGFVYLGTFVQAMSLGYLTSKSWTYWPLFLIPFSLIGLYLLTRIWHAKPKGKGGH